MCWWPLWIQLTGLSFLLVSWWVRHMKITSRRLKFGGWGYQRVVKVFNFPAFSLYALNCCSVDIQLLSHVWLCDSMDCSMPGFPALYSLPELFQLLSIQSVMPFNQLILCLPPFPPAFHLSQHQSLFQWAGSLYQVAIGGELQLQHQSFPMNIQGWFPLWLTGLISLLCKGLSTVFSNTTVWNHQYALHIRTYFLLCDLLSQREG